MSLRTAVTLLLLALPVGAQGTLTGHVREPSGFGVVGAEIRVDDRAEVAALTDANGAFRITGLRPGPVRLAARRMGFRPGSVNAVIIDGAAVDVLIAVELAPIPLEEVRVTERRQPFDSRLAGFNQRRQKKVGTFITRERIEASSSTSFSDLLGGVPGVHLVSSNSFRNAVRFRGQNCPPLVFIDGFAAGAGEFDVDFIDPASVEGIEIYMSMLTVPVELAAPRGMTSCGVIAVWSRPFRPAPRPKKPMSSTDLQRLVAQRAVFTAAEVDTAARAVPGTFFPIYPDSLWRAGTDGDAVVEFVVDALGRVDPQLIVAVSASHPAFLESVRDGLVRAKYEPAVRGGRHVRQLVRLPVKFAHPAP